MAQRRPSPEEALRFWLKLGFISFGGPTGQIAIMHAELVEKRRWISEERFLHALNFCMLLPGPEAQQLAAYIGWFLHGIWGGVAAGALFVLPAAVILWALSWLYMAGGNIAWVAAVFYGLQPAVVAIVAAAILRIGGKALKNSLMWCVAALAFSAIFFLKLPFVAIILAAALLGLAGGHLRPDLFITAKDPDSRSRDSTGHEPWPSAGRTLRVVTTCLVLWIGPIVLAGLFRGRDDILFQEGIFFSKAALVTFGGAYAVLPYVAQQAVEHYEWVGTPQMMAGLALAETTPGPLIMVLQFVGFVGAWQNPGGLSPLIAGTLGAAITTWTTFLPSFLFVLAGAPYVERVRHIRALSAALSTVTAAVVGVILNLAVWFGQHVFFPTQFRPDAYAIALATLFFFGLWKGRWSAVSVVVAGGLLGLAGKLLAGI
ncbi:MAG: chromate efflux transporter [Terrimicrobiaceae bacterium]